MGIRDLGLLKRDISLHKRYGEWAVGIVEEYGSVGEVSFWVEEGTKERFEETLYLIQGGCSMPERRPQI